MKLNPKVYILIIVVSLIVGSCLACLGIMGYLDFEVSKKSIDATSLESYEKTCSGGKISRFSTGFPFSAYKDCAYSFSGTYCNVQICKTGNFGNISMIFNGLFWSFITFFILRIIFRKKILNK
jgi:hypothetical protein